MRPIDVRMVRPQEAVLVAAAEAKKNGLNPFVLRMSPYAYAYLELGLDYLHEYIDEGERSYLVMRTPERLLVCTDTSLNTEMAIMECRSPDEKVEVLLAC